MKRMTALVVLLLLSGCADKVVVDTTNVDTLIVNGTVYTGDNAPGQALDVGLCGSTICALALTGKHSIQALRTVDATGMIVSPGFIDPHTHTFAELVSEDKHHNLNYVFQGVTTVVNGNDGGGPAVVVEALEQINRNGVGTNFAMFAGHGSIRERVMGREKRQATPAELDKMKQLVQGAMEDGALGLSTGLYYVPGQFANTDEIIALAKVASENGGIYDSHIRDESSFSIGFLQAVDEAIEIAEKADIHLHLAHIKALGVDVWGQSEDAISKIEQARQRGTKISADQYPWLASGTNIHSAVIPKWAMADSNKAFLARLDYPGLKGKIRAEVKDNIRRRGGASKLLITASKQQDWVGKTLAELASEWGLDPVEATIKMVRAGRHRVASYNMNPEDVERFMSQDWVVTSSDGTNGHPRKYGSFPKKYRQYVKEKKLLSMQQFIHRSSAATAKILGLSDRGVLQDGFAADVIVFDPETFRERADFSQWNVLSTGIKYVFVNGQMVVEEGTYTEKLAGKFLRPAR